MLVGKLITPLRFFYGLLDITPMSKEWCGEFNTRWLKRGEQR